MSKVPLILPVFVLFAVATSASAAATEGSESPFEFQLDVPWRTVGDVTLRADFYWPSSGCPCPGILELHGGGFAKGTRKWNTGVSIDLAMAGYHVMNTDYRQNGEMDPALDDSIAAVSFLRRRPGVDASRVGVHGTSAGAILATQVAMRGWTIGVLGGVSWSGGTQNPDVTGTSAALMLAHARSDDEVPYSNSVTAFGAYTAVGRPTELLARPGHAHGVDFQDDPIVMAETIEWLHRFVTRRGDSG